MYAYVCICDIAQFAMWFTKHFHTNPEKIDLKFSEIGRRHQMMTPATPSDAVVSSIPPARGGGV